jgi:uncharacterized protein YciI
MAKYGLFGRPSTMFLVIMTYLKPLEIVEHWLASHRNHLEDYYQKGYLLASGPQNPRTGGILVVALGEPHQVEAMMQQDPFVQHEIASYQIIEFNPVKGSAEFYQALDAAKRLQS